MTMIGWTKRMMMISFNKRDESAEYLLVWSRSIFITLATTTATTTISSAAADATAVDHSKNPSPTPGVRPLLFDSSFILSIFILSLNAEICKIEVVLDCIRVQEVCFELMIEKSLSMWMIASCWISIAQCSRIPSTKHIYSREKIKSFTVKCRCDGRRSYATQVLIWFFFSSANS